jgi:hypothetical protein
MSLPLRDALFVVPRRGYRPVDPFGNFAAEIAESIFPTLRSTASKRNTYFRTFTMGQTMVIKLMLLTTLGVPLFLPDFRYYYGAGNMAYIYDEVRRDLEDHINESAEVLFEGYEDSNPSLSLAQVEGYKAYFFKLTDAGGCQLVREEKVFGDVKDYYIKYAEVFPVVSPRTNDCLFHALSYQWYGRKQKTSSSHRVSPDVDIPLLLSSVRRKRKMTSTGDVIRDIRRRLGLADGVSVPFTRIPDITSMFHMNIFCYSSCLELLVMGTCSMPVCNVHLVLYQGHYYLLKDAPKIRKKGLSEPVCERCFNTSCVHIDPRSVPTCSKSAEPNGSNDDEPNGSKNDVTVDDLLSTSHQFILLHGPGGTGKTFLANELRRLTPDCVYLVPTNLCAVDNDAKTLFSYVGLKRVPNSDDFKQIREKFPVKSLPSMLIIDEISMISASLLDYLNVGLKHVSGSVRPFGGVKIVFVGDFLQLAPIKEDFLFKSSLWMEIEQSLQVFNLTLPKRYGDEEWFSLLMELRQGECSANVLEKLKSRILPADALLREVLDKATIALFGKNNLAETFNEEAISLLPGTIVEITCKYDNVKRKVKVNARVICDFNDLKLMGIVNGSLGVIESFSEDVIAVRYDGNITVCYDSNKPVPFRPAYAMSIHKSQGKTLDRVIVCLNKQSSIFTDGQAYVALSRCKSFSSTYIVGNVCPSVFKCRSDCLKFNQWCDLHPRPLWSTYFNVETAKKFGASFLPWKKCEDVSWHALFHNTLFFDFETYENKTERPYFNFMCHYVNGKRMKEYTLCRMCDKSLNVAVKTYEIIMGIVIAQCDNYIAHEGQKQDAPPLRLCAYNGGGFDFHFFTRCFLSDNTVNSRFQMQTTMKGTKILVLKLRDMKATIRRVGLEIHDLLNLIPHTSLSQACKEFLHDSSLEKDTFPHLFMREEVFEMENFVVDLQPCHFPFQMQRNLPPSLSSYDLHFHLHSYGSNDVELLVKLYEKFDNLCLQLLAAPVLFFLTAAKMTWYGFCKSIHDGLPRAAKALTLNKHPDSRYKTHNRLFRLPIPLMTRYHDEMISKAIIGGRCYPRVLDFKSLDDNGDYETVKDFYVYLDICSMYVHIMMTYNYPTGHYKYSKGSLYKTTLNVLDYWNPMNESPYGLFLVEFVAFASNLEPVLPVYVNGKLQWNHVDGCQWMTNIDVYLLIKNKYTISGIHEAFVWERATPIFKEWVSKTFTGKDRASHEGNKAEKTMWKLLGNSCYGAALQRDFGNEFLFSDSYEEVSEFVRAHASVKYLNMEHYLDQSDKKLALVGERTESMENELTKRPRYLGAFTLAWSRYMFDYIYDLANVDRLNPTAESVCFQPLYGDTDSLLVHSSMLRALQPFIGEGHGLLDDELAKNGKWSKIVGFASCAPKSYALKALQYDGTYIEKVKTKGIPKSGFRFHFQEQIHDKFTFDMFYQICRNNLAVKVETDPRIRAKGLVLNGTDVDAGIRMFDITREKLSRTLGKNPWQGRRRLTDEEQACLPVFMVQSRTLTVPINFSF